MALAYLKLFWDALESLESLSPAERGNLLTALLQYGKTGIVPELPGNERFLFPMFRAQMDRDAAQYDRLCETQRTNGIRGGRPRKKPAGFSETQKTQEEEKDQEKEKDKEKEEDKDLLPPQPPRRGGRRRRKAPPAQVPEDPLGDMVRMERFLLQLRKERTGQEAALPALPH
ncbi:MAG: hypothetical protein K2P20_06900 [Oscillospiraceae bacterium]|nr:hypothetical protein [Oscillospiraceae bacterium]